MSATPIVAFEGMSDEEMLLDLRVLGRDDDSTPRPTLAGLLALGRYPQRCYPRLNISAALFPGISRDEVFSTGRELVRTAVFVGPIPTMVADAVDTLMDWSGGITGASAARPPYVRAVLRETISNALIHRDYSPDAVGTPVHVDMFPDRIEITNPGGLFGAVTKHTMKHPVSSSTRNPFLFSLLRSVPTRATAWCCATTAPATAASRRCCAANIARPRESTIRSIRSASRFPPAPPDWQASRDRTLLTAGHGQNLP